MLATQKFGEHEQASNSLNFASKSSKGKIFRAVLMDHSSPLNLLDSQTDWSFLRGLNNFMKQHAKTKYVLYFHPFNLEVI